MASSTNIDVVVDFVDNLTKPMNDALGNVNQLSNKFYSSMGKVGAGLTAIGAAGIAGITSAVSAYADFEKEMSNVGAVTESTEDQMKSLSKVAQDLGAKTKFTALEAAKAMSELGMAGFSTDEIMQSIEGTMSLAAATNIDLAQAAEISSNVLRGFNLQASEAGRVVDVMAKAANSSSIDMSDMFESMKYFAPTAAAFKISMEEASAVIGILGNNGIKGSLATRALGTAITRLTKPTDAMAGVMKELNLDFFNAQGQFIGMAPLIGQLENRFKGMTDEQKQSALATLFGAEAIQEFNVLLSAGSDGLTKYTNDMKNAGGTANEMAGKQMDNLAGSVELLTGALDAARLAIGEKLAGPIRSIAELLTSLVDKFNGLSPATQDMIAKILVFGTALVTVAGFIGIVVGFIPTLVAGFSAIATGAAVAWAAITGPIGLIIIAIAALGAAIYMIVKHWDEIKAKAIEIWGYVSDFIMGVVTSVGEWITAKWNEITAFITSVWTGIKDFFAGIWNGIVDIAKFALALMAGLIILAFDAMGIDIMAVWETIRAGIVYYWDAFTEYISTKINEIVEWVTTKMRALQNIIRDVWNAVKSIVSMAWEAIKLAVSQGLDSIMQKVRDFIQPIKDAFSNVWDAVKSSAASAMDSVMQTIKGALNWVLEKINTIIRAANKVAQTGAAALGISIPQLNEIPMLANGGIVTKPTLAMVGEAGPEAVIPLSKGRNYGVGGSQTINIVVNGDVTGQDLIERVGRELTRMVKLSTATV